MTQNIDDERLLRVHQACALRDSDPVRAFEEFRKLSEDDGCPDGMMQLGWSYEKGIGTAPNRELAETWYRRAYELGSDSVKKQAIVFLGWRYLARKDYANAREIYSVGAEMNITPAIYHLGRMYWHGWGVEKQPSKARELFERASNQGNLYAERNLAFLLMSGRFGMRYVIKGIRMYLRVTAEVLGSALRGRGKL